MSVDVRTQPHPASQQAAVAHTLSTHCQTKHYVDDVIDLEFLPLHCSVNKGKSRVPWVVLCNVTMYFKVTLFIRKHVESQSWYHCCSTFHINMIL